MEEKPVLASWLAGWSRITALLSVGGVIMRLLITPKLTFGHKCSHINKSSQSEVLPLRHTPTVYSPPHLKLTFLFRGHIPAGLLSVIKKLRNKLH